MTQRQELLSAILARLERITTAQDMALALEPGALEEARQLAGLLSGAGGPHTGAEDPQAAAEDLQARYVLGWLHLYRYQALPKGHGQQDLDDAVAMFMLCFVVGAGEVPGPLRRRVAAKAIPVAMDFLRHAMNTTDPDVVGAAIGLWRRIVAAIPDDEPAKATMWSNTGAALHARFKLTGDAADLDEAVEAARSAVAIVAGDDPNRAGLITNLGAMLGERYQVSRAPGDLDAAIEAQRTAIAMAPDGHSDRGGMLSNLASSLRFRFGRNEDPADLDEAIALAREAVAAAPLDHPDRPGILINLASMLRARFQHAGDPADLDAAIEVSRDAVAGAGAGRPDSGRARGLFAGLCHDRFVLTKTADDLDAAIEAARDAVTDAPNADPVGHANLAVMLHDRFSRRGDQADLDDAIEITRVVAQRSPPDDPRRAVWLSDLGVMLHSRFKRTESPADLDDALDALRSAVTAADPAGDNYAAIVLNLAGVLHARYDHSSRLADLDEAIEVVQTAVAAIGADHPQRFGLLTALIGDLGRKAEQVGTQVDLDAAIEMGREALAAAPAGDPDRVNVQANLGELLRYRFGRTGRQADLEAAIDADRAALLSTEAGDSSRAGRVANLGAALRARFDRTGSLEDLDAAIELAREAVEATGGGEPDKARYLSNLTVALAARFERTGALADLDAAIDAGRSAVEATRAGHPNRAWRLNNLAMALDSRFERTGALADLDAAIEMGRAAVDGTPGEHPERARYLSNLGVSLLSRFDRIEDPDDLDAAIEAGRAAVAATPENHSRRAGRLSNLGMALRRRYSRNGSLDDLEASIAASRQAVAIIPDGDPEQPLYLSNLGVAMETMFQRTQDLDDLAAAIEAARAAVDGTPADQPLRARYLLNLGLYLRTRFQRTRDPADRDAAVSVLTTAAGLDSAAPVERIPAARAAARLMANDDPGRAAGLLAGAVRLLSEVAPRHLVRGDQQHEIGRFAGLASDAAALTLLGGPDTAGEERAAQALRLLEAGRMVLLSQMLDTRDDLTDLREQHPALAERFTRLRDQLDRAEPMAGEPPRPAAPGTAWGGNAEDRRRAATDLAATLAEIRTTAGFASFGLPPADEELLAQAAKGPIVTFNVSDYRSDAFLVTTAGIDLVPLPGLKMDALVERINSFQRALQVAADGRQTPDDRVAAQQTLSDVLGWLWDTAAEPVLDALGFGGPAEQGRELPRVWWSPGGLLGLLPIHAAGHHAGSGADGGGQRTVMDRVISSYTPTVRSLRYARERGRIAAQGPALIVGMPSTPGQEKDLPYVRAEISVLRSLLPDHVLLIEPGSGSAPTGSMPTKDNVLRYLPECSVAHFACHGATDRVDPSASLLFLHDYQTAPFTVASIGPVQHDHLQLVYLSACRTAFTGTGLMDEAIHIASAFQLAGSRHVIGTLWEINDAVAVNIAAAFYDHLLSAPGTLDADKAAYGLHHAVRAVRETYPRIPSLWAAHIHAGA